MTKKQPLEEQKAPRVEPARECEVYDPRGHTCAGTNDNCRNHQNPQLFATCEVRLNVTRGNHRYSDGIYGTKQARRNYI